MASSLTSFDAFLKETYTKDKIDDLTKKDHPLYGQVKKEEDVGGDQYVHPFMFSNPQGLGATLAKAQAGSNQTTGGNLQSRKWICTWGDYSAAVSIGDKVIKASRNNLGAFLRNQEVEIDGLYKSFGDTFASYLFSNGGQALGSFNISSGVCTLINSDDIVNFEVGQILVVSANDGSDPSHIIVGGSAAGYVVAVNRNAGTFSVSATSGGSVATPTNWANGQFVFRDGDFGGAGATRILLGLSAWIPSSDPSATSFEGVNRTADITRMSGVRLASTETNGVSLEQRVKKLITRMTGRNAGPGPDAFYLNPEKWQALADQLESRGYREIGKTAEFGYEYITVHAGGKSCKVFADAFCPVSTGFALHMDSIKLASLGKVPEVLNGDGLEMLRAANSNDFEYRLQAYPAFIVPAPGFCGRVATV
ncbi:MAG: hypothetical protein WDO74_17960 [Pseudomonadota bacterium]